MDVGVFQETKLMEGIYSWFSAGYKVVAAPAPIQHQGGVVIFYWDSPVLAVEAIRHFGANVIACQMAVGKRRWYVVGCYLAPGDGTTIRDVKAEMTEKPRGAELIVAGDLKKGNLLRRVAGERKRRLRRRWQQQAWRIWRDIISS